MYMLNAHHPPDAVMYVERWLSREFIEQENQMERSQNLHMKNEVGR